MLVLDDLNQSEKAFANDIGLPSTICVALHEARQARAQNLTNAWHQIAEWIVAPVLAGFIGWMAQQNKTALYLGVMREGRFLARLMQNLCGITAKEVWLNRNLTMLAAYGCGDDEALLNWLLRTRIELLTKTQALQALLGNEARSDASVIHDVEAAKQFIAELHMSGSMDAIRRRAVSLSDQIVTHWRHITNGTANVCLMDFASAGNIQRSLQTILGARPVFHNITGLNFSMTAGSKWAIEKGCAMRGWLAKQGEPEWFAAAVARSPELMEIFTATPVGSLIGYAADGQPICGKSFLTHAQQNHIYNLQEHIADAAAHYYRALGDQLTADMARCVWGRFILSPSIVEAETLGDWQLDTGLDGVAKRFTAPNLNAAPEPWAKTQTAWPEASRLRS